MKTIAENIGPLFLKTRSTFHQRTQDKNYHIWYDINLALKTEYDRKTNAKKGGL